MKTRILPILSAGFPLAVLCGWTMAAPVLPTGQPKEIASFQADTQELVFSPDGKTLASAGRTGKVKLWDTASWKNVADFRAHSPDRRGGLGIVLGIAFSPDGKTLATSGDDGTVKLWDIATSKNTEVFDDPSYFGRRLTFSPDGKVLVCDKQWLDLATKKDRPLVEKCRGTSPVARFDPDGKLLVGMTFIHPDPPSFAVWDGKTGKQIFSYKSDRQVVRCFALSPDGKSVVSDEGDYSTRRWVIRLWNLASGKNTTTIEQPELPRAITFSPDGNVLAVSLVPDAKRNDHPSIIRLFEVSSGKVLATLEGHKRPIGCLAFSPDGRLLASGDYSGTIKIWRLPKRYKAE